LLTGDGSIVLMLLFTMGIIFTGIFLNLNGLQWTIVGVISAFLLFIGIYRSAAILLLNHDRSISSGQAIRIRAMSNALMAITGGISFFAYLIIFMPKINMLL
jgi:hypothetical protein